MTCERCRRAELAEAHLREAHKLLQDVRFTGGPAWHVMQVVMKAIELIGPIATRSRVSPRHSPRSGRKL